MHEMALSMNMVHILEEQAIAEGFARVRRVWIEIGALAHVDPEAMAFCFDAATRGTLAEGAVLEIVSMPGEGWCLSCDCSVPIAARHDPCPRCGGYRLQVNAGEEMRVRQLEVD